MAHAIYYLSFKKVKSVDPLREKRFLFIMVPSCHEKQQKENEGRKELWGNKPRNENPKTFKLPVWRADKGGDKGFED